jgi:hypothetical protein
MLQGRCKVIVDTFINRFRTYFNPKVIDFQAFFLRTFRKNC